jgi:hypothetical protein
MIEFHMCIPKSHRGARCLSSLFESCIGLQCCRIILSNSLEPSCPCIVLRLFCRVVSTAVDASRILLAISLS